MEILLVDGSSRLGFLALLVLEKKIEEIKRSVSTFWWGHQFLRLVFEKKQHKKYAQIIKECEWTDSRPP